MLLLLLWSALFTFVHHGWSIQQDSADTEEGPYKSLSESYSLQDEGSQKISREEVNTDAVATFSTIKEVIFFQVFFYNTK